MLFLSRENLTSVPLNQTQQLLSCILHAALRPASFPFVPPTAAMS
jgi:hypothetical protein